MSYWDGSIYNKGVINDVAGDILFSVSWGTATKQATSIYFDQGGGGSEGKIFIFTQNKIDVSDFSSLQAVTNFSKKEGSVWTTMCLSADYPTTNTNVAKTSWVQGTSSLDVSSITGSYYIVFHSSMAAAWDNVHLTGNITEIKLIP